MKKILLILFLLGVAFAGTSPTISATYDDADFATDWYFSTSQRFTSDMTCRVSSCPFSSDPNDCILSGTPCDGVANVCPGTSLEITPRASGRWAVGGNLNVLISYPGCPIVGYCPAMESYTSKTERDTSWLTSTDYADYDVDTTTYDITLVGPEGIPVYNDLGTFYTQSLNYRQYTTDPIDTNKRGYANIFCKGNARVERSGSLLGTTDAASPTPVTTTFSSETIVSLSTVLRDVECFAAVVKYPKNDVDHTEFFRLNFFRYDAPTVPQVTETELLGVYDVQPSLSVEGVSVTEFGSNYILAITLRNDGDVPVMVTRVLPTGSGFTTSLGPSTCFTYGIPTPPCPSSSGFGVTINRGSTHTVYVYYGGFLSGTPVTLIYQALEPVCSAETDFELDIPVSSDIVRCEIEPPVLEAGQYEVHEYDVTCYNVMGSTVPCAGADWYWTGLSGGFIERTNSYAWAYTSSSAGSTGTLNYRTGSVVCSADITSSEISPYFDCELDPSSADLEIGDSQYFDLNCYVDGAPSAPTSAEYDNVDGLDGSISDSSTAGTRFTGTVTSDGNLRAFARKSHHGDPTLLGAVAFAHINVGNATETPETPGTGGEEAPCEIRPGSSDLYPHDGGLLTLYCGDEGARTVCSLGPGDVDWGIASELYGGIIENTGTTARYVVGSTGTPAYGFYISGIRATIEGGSCWASVNIIEPTCLEYT